MENVLTDFILPIHGFAYTEHGMSGALIVTEITAARVLICEMPQLPLKTMNPAFTLHISYHIFQTWS